MKRADHAMHFIFILRMHFGTSASVIRHIPAKSEAQAFQRARWCLDPHQQASLIDIHVLAIEYYEGKPS